MVCFQPAADPLVWFADCSKCIRTNFDFTVGQGHKASCPECRSVTDQADLRPNLALRAVCEAFSKCRPLLLKALQQSLQPPVNDQHPPEEQLRSRPKRQRHSQQPSQSRHEGPVAPAADLGQRQALHRPGKQPRVSHGTRDSNTHLSSSAADVKHAPGTSVITHGITSARKGDNINDCQTITMQPEQDAGKDGRVDGELHADDNHHDDADEHDDADDDSADEDGDEDFSPALRPLVKRQRSGGSYSGVHLVLVQQNSCCQAASTMLIIVLMHQIE